MLRSMTFREFREWMLFASLEPFDESRQDYRIASIVAAIYNVHRGKNQKARTVKEMKLQFGDDAEMKQSVREQVAFGKMMAMTFNAIEKQKSDERERARDRRQSRHTVRQATSGR